MATKTSDAAAPTQTQVAPKVKQKRAPIDLVTRTKSTLSQAALRSKINIEQLDDLAAHVAKLKALLS